MSSALQQPATPHHHTVIGVHGLRHPLHDFSVDSLDPFRQLQSQGLAVDRVIHIGGDGKALAGSKEPLKLAENAPSFKQAMP